MPPTETSDFSKNLTVVPRPYAELNLTQRMYVDWKALNGLVYDQSKEGSQVVPRKMPLYELAAMCGVTVDAFYQAKASIPNFWELVAERRRELGGQSRLAQVHETWFLEAIGGSWPHMEAYLRNFDPGYKEAKQKVEHDLGEGLADALNIARERQLKAHTVVEGEVVDEPPDA